MKKDIYWVETIHNGRIGIISRPRGGDWIEDEIGSLRDQGVDVLVCLLQADEIEELELEREAAVCEALSVKYLSYPISDRSVPDSTRETRVFVAELERLLAEGKSVVIHCRQGVGRSALITACVLVNSGSSVPEAFNRVALSRGCPVPDTQEQRDWVTRFIDDTAY